MLVFMIALGLTKMEVSQEDKQQNPKAQEKSCVFTWNNGIKETEALWFYYDTPVDGRNRLDAITEQPEPFPTQPTELSLPWSP